MNTSKPSGTGGRTVRVLSSSEAQQAAPWSLTQFSKPEGLRTQRRPGDRTQTPASPGVTPDVPAADLRRIEQNAHDEAYAVGYEAGMAAANAEVERLRWLAESAGSVFSEFEQSLAPQLVSLAVALAREVLHREIQTDHSALIGIVREAFDQLTGAESQKRLFVHPADAELLRAHMGDELKIGAWTVIEDLRIEPGSCRILTQQSEIDASMEGRWRRVIARLGQELPWRDPEGQS